MAGFKLTTFTGLSKKVSPRLLPEDMAQNAQNVFLDSGRIEGIPTDVNDPSESGNTPQHHTYQRLQGLYSKLPHLRGLPLQMM